MSINSSKHSISITHDSRPAGLITAETIRNCVMDALVSSSADDLLRCLAGSDWTREYALCRVGELLQDYLRPLLGSGTAQGVNMNSAGGCKACKEKDKQLAYLRHQQSTVSQNLYVASGPSAHDKQLSKQLEEAIYLKSAMEQQLQRLKEELQVNTETISTLKSDRIKADIAGGEWQKKITEAMTKANKAVEDAEHASQERDSALAEADKLERLYKNERRRAANLERELEQLQYTHNQLLKNSGAEITSLREHVSLLKADNLSLITQVSTLSTELNSKSEEEKKETNKLSKKLKDLECQFDGLKVTNESLEKKVEFYKEQLLKGGSKSISTTAEFMPQDLVKSNQMHHDETVHASAKEYRGHPFESFSSFNHKRVKELNLEVREALSDNFENLQKFTSAKQVQAMKAEIERLRIKLGTVLMQVKHLKELFKVEISTNRQELGNLRGFLFNTMESLSQKFRLQSRRMKILHEKETKVRGPPIPDLPTKNKYLNYGEDRKERMYERSSPPRQRDNSSRNINTYLNHQKDYTPKSPLKSHSNKRPYDQQPATPGSFKKFHNFGKPETDEAETKGFKFGSPLRSPARSSPYRRAHPDDDSRRNRRYNDSYGDWEQLGNDIIQKLNRKF